MKRVILSNKNYFFAIVFILFTGLHNLNAQVGDPKLTEGWKPVPAIVTPDENGEAPFSESSLLQDRVNPLTSRNIRARELNI